MKQILKNSIMVREYDAEEWGALNPGKIIGHLYYDNNNYSFSVWDDEEDVIIEVSTAKG